MKIPTTIGVIMDGNRRWAKERGLPLLEGHRKGYEKLKEMLYWVKEAGIKHVIAFTFSSENWKRPEEEVGYLMSLLRFVLEKEIEFFHKENAVLRFAGNMSAFPENLQELIRNAEEKTRSNSGPHLYLALSYGGREEILNAVRSIVKEQPQPEAVTESYFEKHLLTYPMPDPDIIIRTSGEQRLSGFLPWQTAYSELFFTDTYWPAFTKAEFDGILAEYDARERRFGT